MDEKRNNQLKLQGEYNVKLKELEENLLNELAQVQGSILENEQVIKSLETLKQQAAQVTSQMEQSDKILQEIDKVSNEYLFLSEASSKIYFSL